MNDISLEKTKKICGIVLFQTKIAYLYSDKTNIFPHWSNPIQETNTKENPITYSWYFQFIKSNTFGLSAVWGYKELALSPTHYIQLCELEPIAINLFALRKQQLEINSMIPWHWKKRALQTKQGLSMKATCISNTAQTLTTAICEQLSFESTSSFNLTIGRRYTIYGMHAWHDTVFYLLAGDDTQAPCLYPADLFTLVDHLIPIEWYFNYTEQNGALWGYKELALDTQHLDQLLQQEQAALQIFAARKTEIDEWERLP